MSPDETLPPPSPIEAEGDEKPPLPDCETAREIIPGERQLADVVPAFEAPGFSGMTVAATLEKKDDSKSHRPYSGSNQDNVITDHATGLVGVCDGLGSLEGGNLASKAVEADLPKAYAAALSRAASLNSDAVKQMVLDRQLERLGVERDDRDAALMKLTDKYASAIESDPQIGLKALALLDSFEVANEAVNKTKSGTTACIGTIHHCPDGTAWGIIANVGDSRAFKRRPDGQMENLTEDDSMLNFLIESRYLTPELRAEMRKFRYKDHRFLISPKDAIKLGLIDENDKDLSTPIPYSISYDGIMRCVIRTLGCAKHAASLEIVRLEPGSSLVFGTDGLVDKFDDLSTDETDLNELSRTMNSGTALPTERLDRLRSDAKSRKTSYKTDDDIAIVEAIPRFAEQATGATDAEETAG